MVTRGGVVLVLQDNMSAAFGAGDFTSSAVAKASASSVRVGEVLGNTISLEEIMNATKTNVRRDRSHCCERVRVSNYDAAINQGPLRDRFRIT